MNLIIRKAVEQDFQIILALIKEFAAFVNQLEEFTNIIDQMKQKKYLFQCIVTENNSNEIVGYTLYFFAYFMWVGKWLYLEDLYIKEFFRRQKNGTQLLKHIFKIAFDENCKKAHLQVFNWNKKAINFYKKFKAIIDNQLLNFSFNLKEIQSSNQLI